MGYDYIRFGYKFKINGNGKDRNLGKASSKELKDWAIYLERSNKLKLARSRARQKI